MFIGAIIAAVYVVFFMPTGTASAPVDSNNPGGDGGTVSVQDFNFYSYLNGIKSARGQLTFDCEMIFDNNDNLKVQSSHKFETKGANSSIIGSTIYNLNENAAVFDDFTYISDGYRYVKKSGGYVKSENILMDAGNMNLGRIEDVLEREENKVVEDGITCYKYIGAITYSDMSNNLRAYIRNQNINVADINNLVLNFSVFITENGVPYKIVITFEDAKCMIKSSNLNAKNCKASGTLTLTFSGFNGVESIQYPEDMKSATEETYVFTDKLNRYLSSVAANE